MNEEASIPNTAPLSSPGRSELQPFLQAMYKEQCDQARQHETMRQQATTVALTLAGAVITLATASGGALALAKANDTVNHFSSSFFLLYSLLGVFVCGIAVHGRKLSLKHYERSQMHTARARIYRKNLEALFPGCGLGEQLRTDAEASHRTRFAEDAGRGGTDVIEQKLYMLWADLFGFLKRVGVFLIVAPLLVVLFLNWDALREIF